MYHEYATNIMSVFENSSNFHKTKKKPQIIDFAGYLYFLVFLKNFNKKAFHC